LVASRACWTGQHIAQCHDHRRISDGDVEILYGHVLSAQNLRPYHAAGPDADGYGPDASADHVFAADALGGYSRRVSTPARASPIESAARCVFDPAGRSRGRTAPRAPATRGVERRGTHGRGLASGARAKGQYLIPLRFGTTLRLMIQVWESCRSFQAR